MTTVDLMPPWLTTTALVLLICVITATRHRPRTPTTPPQPEGPAMTEQNEACGNCHQPFDPTDTRFDGRAQQQGTPFCRACVDRCHESTDAFHQCAICR